MEIQSLFELRMAMKEEKDRQERELKQMMFEDVILHFNIFYSRYFILFILKLLVSKFTSSFIKTTSC